MLQDPPLGAKSVNGSDSQNGVEIDDSSSYQSSIFSALDSRSSISPASEMESSINLEPAITARRPMDQDELLKAINWAIPTTSNLPEQGNVEPKFRHRSKSFPTHTHLGFKIGSMSFAEHINTLKSFQSVWEKRQAMSDDSSESNICHDKEKTLCSSSHDDVFIFPFFHFNSSDFEYQEYRFPFFRVDASIFFTKHRQRPRFPFSHWSTDLFNEEPKSPLKKLLNMIGLDDVKKLFLSVQDRVKAAQFLRERNKARASRNQKKKDPVKEATEKMGWVRKLHLDLIVTGNPGTGKSTIAELYSEHLRFLGVVSSINRARPRPPRHYSWFRSQYDDSSDDECRMVDSGHDRDQVAIVTEDSMSYREPWDSAVMVVVGSREHVKSFLGQSKARGRFFQRVDLKDYNEDELLAILVGNLADSSLKVEGGFEAPFLRMFLRQIKGRKNFQNVKTVQTEIEKVRRRRGERLEKATCQKQNMIVSIPSASYNLVESDFFGTKPTEFYDESEAWGKLVKMAGMEKVKEAVKELVTRRKINYSRAIEGLEPLKTSFHYVFLGPPGTGKTTVATLFGQCIADLGYIESGEVVMKKPTDFLGQYVGHSEEMTKEILEETKDKVLIIDEAHMFYHGTDHGTDDSDIFRKGIVDTIVANVDNEPGNNRCIILMGYPDRMKEFYRKTNPGFQRRFPLEDAFVFENYDDKALEELLDLMIAQDKISVTPEAKEVAMEVLKRERDRPNFGNGGAVRNLLSRAQIAYSKRIESSLAEKTPEPDITNAGATRGENPILLQPQDFDPEYDRGRKTDQNFRSLFKDLVGFHDIIRKFEGYQTMAANMRQRDLDPREQIPFSFIFKGAPGTGKTTTARALGRMYYDMGFLSTREVLDCSVTDLIGTTPGSTGPKVQNLLERALGKVLLIDEAYRLGQRTLASAFTSSLTQEAVGELVDCMTKEKYAHKLVIVLAGYEKSMDELMSTNEGLRSRFTELRFPNMQPKDCLRLVERTLAEKKIRILRADKDVQKKAIGLFRKLSSTEAWANARDAKEISKRTVHRTFMKEVTSGVEVITIQLKEVIDVLRRFYDERKPKPDSASES